MTRTKTEIETALNECNSQINVLEQTRNALEIELTDTDLTPEQANRVVTDAIAKSNARRNRKPIK